MKVSELMQGDKAMRIGGIRHRATYRAARRNVAKLRYRRMKRAKGAISQ